MEMDLKTISLALDQIAEEKGISSKQLVEILESAIATAYKKEYGQKGQIIKAQLDLKTGGIKFFQVKNVVDDSMLLTDEELEEIREKKTKGEEIEDLEKVRFNPERHIMIDEAKKENPKIKVGEELVIPLEPREDYGRIAAQAAKQVIIQKIKESEKELLFSEFKGKEGEVLSGIVQRIEPRKIYIDIGRTVGILHQEEQVRGEVYRPGQRLKVYIMNVEQTQRGPVIFLSRSFPKLVSKLFEIEVPEISNGIVEIKSIARDAGLRTKIAVHSNDEDIDPIGACVGPRGSRVLAVMNELGGEKIDIVQWDEDPKKFIGNALSPEKSLDIEIVEKNKAVVSVPEDQLSLAIGRDGQNVRLAVRLTGWKLDVKSAETEKIEGEGEETEDQEEVLEKIEKTDDSQKEEKPVEQKKRKTKSAK
jgi:N utilization substance protein A